MDMEGSGEDASVTRDSESNVIVPIEEFAHDIEVKLGRANGNVYVRKPGVDNLHDGQIMVRLKKKRFIIIDYSIVPTSKDIQEAAATPHVMVPTGAGNQKCGTPHCTKVGVPVMLFDSNPEEPSSLYLRSGLCFTCQRLLNEKRRTQRKRKSDTTASSHDHGIDESNLGMNHHGATEHYSIESAEKKLRLNGEILDLNPDAIIINGPIDDTRHHQPGYEYEEIGEDLHKIVTQDVAQETMQLLTMAASTSPSNVNTEEHAHVLTMYEKAFVSISKGIFLLSQWKSSWDAAVANGGAETATEHALDGNEIVDTVACAAAVAAAQSVSNDQGSSTMIPLHLNPNDKKDNVDDDNHVKVEEEEVVDDDEDKPEVFGV
mmetsp:Transcript_7553/g.8645  ORF Transcript_7553/g.8645 Transcript_7553/m.8645 type:complete len:374 (-) Transcript_7553:279-1400(-)